jgi:RNA polymerase sigma-70 factor (subfamily 1)
MKVPGMDEGERQVLIDRAVNGDGDCLQRLIVEYHAPLLAKVKGRLSPALRRYVSPEDVLQQAYIEAFKAATGRAFENPAGFYRWLERICLDQLKNACRHLRRDRRDVRRNLSGSAAGTRSALALVERLPASPSTPSRHPAKQEACAAALSSLARLSDDQRTVVQMRFLEDRPVQEIAAELGKSPGAVHMLIKRGLDNLAELMGSISRFLSRM